MRLGQWMGGVAVGLLALAGAAAAQQPGAPALAPLGIVTPPAVDSAIARGTRTRTGAPGPRYWQNSADYDIGVQVTPADSLLRGQERITYHNNSPRALPFVVVRLYQNLMGTFGAREQPSAEHTGGMILDEVKENGRTVSLPRTPMGRSPDTVLGARIYGTLMRVPLATPLPPGGTATFDVRWHFTIPGEWAPRMGMQDATTGQIAQWYPQIAVFDDLEGWDAQQYTGTGEFYLDYGHFRYAVTIPAGFVIGGTGTLQNPQQVLNPDQIAALARAARTSDVAHVLTRENFGAGKATKGPAGSMLTWQFTADSVRDVAFSFGDHYLWDATSAVVDSASGRRALVNVMYRPGAPQFENVWKMAQYALETHSARMVPYPYPQLTETEGGSGGMEYPMTVFVEASPGLYREDMVTAHEIGHEWFPMLVGSNETRYGWQDEGLNTFDTYFATDAFLRDSAGAGLKESRQGYLNAATHTDEPLVIMSPANAFGVVPTADYGTEAYDKPGLALWALRATLGDTLFYKAYRTYIRSWSFKHPTPYDFFDTFDSVTGQNLDPFFFQWFFTNERLDQAVTGVTQTGNRVSVTVQNVGRIYAPIDVTAHTADGKTVSWREPMTAWYSGAPTVTTTHDVAGQVVSVTIDEAGNFPDVNRGNNSWKRQ